MKKVFRKIKAMLPKLSKYFFDFLVVFIGVFLAFWLDAKKEEENKEAEQVQIYRAVYEDMNAFHSSGQEEFDKGFINIFQNYKKELDSLIAVKKISARGRLYGDYWHLEIINSLVESGRLSTMDPTIFKGIAGFHSSHVMFLDEIESFNEQYEKYITAHYENGMDSFYKPDSNEPKEVIKLTLNSLDRIIRLAKMLVDNAGNAKYELNQEFGFEEEQDSRP